MPPESIQFYTPGSVRAKTNVMEPSGFFLGLVVVQAAGPVNMFRGDKEGSVGINAKVLGPHHVQSQDKRLILLQIKDEIADESQGLVRPKGLTHYQFLVG